MKTKTITNMSDWSGEESQSTAKVPSRWIGEGYMVKIKVTQICMHNISIILRMSGETMNHLTVNIFKTSITGNV